MLPRPETFSLVARLPCSLWGWKLILLIEGKKLDIYIEGKLAFLCKPEYQGGDACGMQRYSSYARLSDAFRAD